MLDNRNTNRQLTTLRTTTPLQEDLAHLPHQGGTGLLMETPLPNPQGTTPALQASQEEVPPVHPAVILPAHQEEALPAHQEEDPQAHQEEVVPQAHQALHGADPPTMALQTDTTPMANNHYNKDNI